MLDLRPAGIRRNDTPEMPGQPHGSLSGPRPGVPGCVMRRGYLREEIEQRVRIPRPESGIGRRYAGEMIRERHGLGVGAGAGGGVGTSGGVDRWGCWQSGHAPG